MVGMDAFVVLRFLRLCAKICGAAVLGALVMMPLYANAPQQEGVYGINLYTMANIPQKGRLLWCCTVFTWVYSLYFIYLMREEYNYFVYLRQRFMSVGDPDMSLQRLLTVKVENIPATHRSSEKLFFLFHELFPNQVHSVVCNQTVETLESCVTNRDSIVQRLEQCLGYSHMNDELKVKEGQHKSLSIDLATGTPVMVYGGVPYAAAVQYYVSRLIALNEDIAKLQALALLPDAERPDAGTENPYLNPSTNLVKDVVPVKALLSPLLSNSIGAAAVSAVDKVETGVLSLSNSVKSPTSALSAIHAAMEAGNGGASKTPSPTPESAAAAIEATAASRQRRTKPVPPVPMPSTVKKKKIPGDDKEAMDMRYEQPEYSSTGFVTFNSRKAHALAYQVAMLTNRFPDLTAEQAVEPDDVIWHNVNVPQTWISIALTLTDIMYKCGMVFWTGILTFIAVLSNLNKIATYFPLVKQLDPVTYAFVAGLLPVVVMNLFLSLIPTIMAMFSIYFEKLKAKSAVAHQVFRWFFYYSLSNIYLLLITGSVLHSLSDAISDPKSTFYLLGSALPSITLLFTNFLITNVLFGLPMRLLQVVPQLLMYYYDFLGNSSDTVTRSQLLGGPMANVPYDYGANLPTELYVLCIVMTYWTMTPLIAIIGAFYFAGVYIVTKHQFLYLHTREFETGGSFWYGLFDNSFFCLMCATILMVAYVSIREGIYPATALLPLPVVVYYCWCNITDQFKHKSNNMAYNIAVAGDNVQSTLLQSLDEETYAQPCLRKSAMEDIPYPHRLFDSEGQKEPLLVHVSADSASVPTLSGSLSNVVSVKNLKQIANVSAMQGTYIALNTAYYADIRPTVQAVDDFYADMEARFYPNVLERSNAHTSDGNSSNN